MSGATSQLAFASLLEDFWVADDEDVEDEPRADVQDRSPVYD